MSKKRIEWSELFVSLAFKKEGGIVRPCIVDAKHGSLEDAEELSLNDLITELNEHGLLNECCSQGNRI